MIDLSGKYVTTKSNEESGELLKCAVAQGYRLCANEREMERERIFHFAAFPFRIVTVPSGISTEIHDNAERYVDIFGDKYVELNKILSDFLHWCRSYGYERASLYAKEETELYAGSAFVSSSNGAKEKVVKSLLKPRKVTVAEIEKVFGFPIEIVPDDKAI